MHMGIVMLEQVLDILVPVKGNYNATVYKDIIDNNVQQKPGRNQIWV